MFSNYKKYALIILIISLLIGAYWFYFGSAWAVAVTNEHSWKYSLISKSETNFTNIIWESDNGNQIDEESHQKYLVFQADFNVQDPSKILEGLLEYNNKYSAKILINGIECADVNRDLIIGDLHKNGVKVEAYWSPRKVKLNKETLTKALRKGINTVRIVIYNLQDISAIVCSKKQLSFLVQGQQHDFKTNFKTEKPASFFTESSLPIFKINTKNKAIPDEPKVEASLYIINNKASINKWSDPSINYSIKIERRGNTSQSFVKKSYSFNVYHNSKKQSTPLLDLPSSKKWVLYGPFSDKSLIRNALTYSIYRQMGNYAPRTQFIDLVINNNYQGIYVLTEKIQIGPKHLNIPELKQNEKDNSKYTGGYLLEIDRNEWKGIYPPEGDTSSIPLSYMVYSPKKDNLKPNLEHLIKSQLNLFEQHIYENDNIYNYLDINSFIDYLIITELTKNIDGYCLSTFLYNKNINSSTPKFYLGPIWDYNFSFGLADYGEGFNPEGFVYNSTKFKPFWWKKLFNDKVFKTALDKRYTELRKTSLSNSNLISTIDSLSFICKKSAELNFKKWRILGPSAPWPNYFAGETYKDEVDYVRNWTDKRLTFLDKHMLKK